MQLSAPNTGSQIQLIAFVPSDTVRHSDSLRVTVIIKNDGSPLEFTDTYESFTYAIIDPAGQAIPNTNSIAVDGSRSPLTSGYGRFAGLTERPRHFELTKRGLHKLVAAYRGVAFVGDGPRQSVRLRSDTATFYFAPPGK